MVSLLEVRKTEGFDGHSNLTRRWGEGKKKLETKQRTSERTVNLAGYLIRKSVENVRETKQSVQ